MSSSIFAFVFFTTFSIPSGADGEKIFPIIAPQSTACEFMTSLDDSLLICKVHFDNNCTTHTIFYASSRDFLQRVCTLTQLSQEENHEIAIKKKWEKEKDEETTRVCVDLAFLARNFISEEEEMSEKTCFNRRQRMMQYVQQASSRRGNEKFNDSIWGFTLHSKNHLRTARW